MKTLTVGNVLPTKLTFEPSPDDPALLRITRQSTLSGKQNTMDLSITEQQLTDWARGQLIQRVMPHLSAEQREFLISGSTPAEWDAMTDAISAQEEGEL
jgi:hypothetical protein